MVALALMAALLLPLSLAGGCAKSAPPEVTALFDRLEAIEDVLREAQGDQDQAEAALWALYQDRSDDILAYREGIAPAVDGMEPKAQTAYTEKLAEKRSAIQNLVRGYPKPIQIIQIVNKMI